MVSTLISSVLLMLALPAALWTADQWSGQTPSFTSLIDLDTLDMVAELYSKPHVNKWKCLGPLGCFYNGPPFYHPKFRPISVLPYDRHRLSVKFLLYTKNNTKLNQKLTWEKPESIQNSFFDPAIETKIILHGLFDMLEITPWIYEMKNELLLRGHYNVIVVDWTRGNRFPYEQAVANTRAVAVEVALTINALMKHRHLRKDKLHMIGHSLGAQIAGYIGAMIPGIRRISGLDPAGIYFSGTDKEVRLDHTDALFVDVIHSDASTFAPLGIGTVDPSGHVDFFPNGGTTQPGCTEGLHIENFLLLGLLPGSRRSVACDHERSIKYYMESINSHLCQPVGLECESHEAFLSGQCGNCGLQGHRCWTMGYHSERDWSLNNVSVPKNYYLLTASKEPFCAETKVLLMSSSYNKSTPYRITVHQYEVYLEVHINVKKTVGKAFLLYQNDGKGIKITLSKGWQKLLPGRTYSYLVNSESEFANSSSVIFVWHDYYQVSEAYHSNETTTRIGRWNIKIAEGNENWKKSVSVKLGYWLTPIIIVVLHHPMSRDSKGASGLTQILYFYQKCI